VCVCARARARVCKIHFFLSFVKSFSELPRLWKNHLSKRRAIQAKIIYLFCPFRAEAIPLRNSYALIQLEADNSFIFYFINARELILFKYIQFSRVSKIYFWFIDIRKNTMQNNPMIAMLSARRKSHGARSCMKSRDSR